MTTKKTKRRTAARIRLNDKSRAPVKKSTINTRQAKRWGLSPELMQLPESHAHRKGIVLRRKDVREFTKKAREYLTVRGIKQRTWELANLRVTEAGLVIPYFYPIAMEQHGNRRDFCIADAERL